MIRRKAQLSFEYIVLFSIMMIMFIIVGTILVSGLEKSRKMESEAAYLAKEIKADCIIASMSESDFQTRIDIPQSIAGTKIFVDIYKAPDNLVVIREENSQQGEDNLVAREFLPMIDSGGDSLNNITGKTIEIAKIGDNISISLSN